MQSSGRTSVRVVAWLAGPLAVGILAAIVCGFVIKRESVREVGGKWKLVLAKPIGASEPGWSWARLYRKTPAGRACVASDVWAKPQFYGDDCAGYEVSRASGRRYFFACGDREPLLAVTAEQYEEWRLTEKGLEPEPVVNDKGKLVPSSEEALAADELKRRALMQPLRTTTDCD